MGGIISAGGGLAALATKNPLSKALGISGEQGEYAKAQNDNPALAALNARSMVGGMHGASGELAQYGMGDKSLRDTLAFGTEGPFKGAQQEAFLDNLATDPMSGSRFATEQVMNNPMLSQLYGKGGALERYGKEEQELASRGFSLKPEDHEAYGQASGNIARMFGSQEQSLAQSLANRGLAASPSGAAGVEYTGLAGNKMEQLQSAQRQIADARMKMNLERLNSTRAALQNMGNSGQAAIQDQYGRQLAGVQRKDQNYQNAAALQMQQNAAANQANMAEMQDKRGAKGMTLGQAFGQGLLSSAGNIGAAPGKFASSAAGSLGGGMGGGASASAPAKPRQYTQAEMNDPSYGWGGG